MTRYSAEKLEWAPTTRTEQCDDCAVYLGYPEFSEDAFFQPWLIYCSQECEGDLPITQDSELVRNLTKETQERFAKAYVDVPVQRIRLLEQDIYEGIGRIAQDVEDAEHASREARKLAQDTTSFLEKLGKLLEEK